MQANLRSRLTRLLVLVASLLVLAAVVASSALAMGPVYTPGPIGEGDTMLSAWALLGIAGLVAVYAVASASYGHYRRVRKAESKSAAPVMPLHGESSAEESRSRRKAA